MAQITQEQRERRIRELLDELNRVPPEQHEVVRVPWSGGPRLCKVITIGADEVLLNPKSHRLRSQLGDDPRWEELSKDKYSEAAQQVIAEHVRGARSEERFQELVQSLLTEGQTEPGVMTHKGVLINANTRAVAIRGFEDPDDRVIRVAVLPSTAKPEELALLELRLQMQKPLKEDYPLTNELLFIEDMHKKNHMSYAQIAKELRIAKKGEQEVELRLKLLDLIRLMQKMPTDPLPLTFFDRVELQQMKELYRTWEELSQTKPAKARQHLELWIVSVAAGVDQVHKLRKVDLKFASEYMLPNLAEDEAVAPAIEKLVQPTTNGDDGPAGVDELMGATNGADSTAEDANLNTLMNALTSRDKRVQVPDTKATIERDKLAEAVNDAIKGGIRDKTRDARLDNKLEAPITNMRQAIRLIDASVEALRAVHGDPEFDDQHRKQLAAAIKKLHRTVKHAEENCDKMSVKTG